MERPGRQQLWILNDGSLSVLKLSPPSPSLEPIPLPFYANHLNILPAADRLVLVPNAYEIAFYSMASRQIDLTAPLPPPD